MPDALPFARLPSLPPDVSDAFESFKLAILRHKLGHWRAVDLGDVLTVLDSLKEFAEQPCPTYRT